MKKLWILTVISFIFSVSLSFILVNAVKYTDCISCTRDGHFWVTWASWPWPSGYCTDGCWFGGIKISNCPCGIICTVATKPSECEGYCDRPSDCGSGQTCINNICKDCRNVFRESDCTGDCCWIPAAEGYNIGKCVAKSEGCENKWICGEEYCEEGEKCCEFQYEYEREVYAYKCFNPDTQECLDNGICTRGKPDITAYPAEIVEEDPQKIMSLNYHTITVKNTDTPSDVCPSSKFSVKVKNCPEGWTCELLTKEFDLRGGDEARISLRVRTDISVTTGTYTINVATKNERTNRENSVEIVYTVKGFCGDGTCDVGEDCDSCPEDCACPSTQCCKEGECVAEGTCWDESVCSDGKWISHCGDGKKNCGEICDSNSDCKSPPSTCYKTPGTCAFDCSSCSYGNPICDGTTCLIGSVDYCNDCTHCGDEKCNCGETTVSCPEDCAKDQCDDDLECDDANPCTKDWCENPEADNSVCHNDNVNDGTDCGDCRECQSGVCSYMCKITEYSCECIDDVCIDCSDYYGDKCGYGSCAPNQKPSWSCIEVFSTLELTKTGTCHYSCQYDENCEKELTPSFEKIVLYKGQNVLGAPGITISNFDCQFSYFVDKNGNKISSKDKPFFYFDASQQKFVGPTDSLEKANEGLAYWIPVESDSCTLSFEKKSLNSITLYSGQNVIAIPYTLTAAEVRKVCGDDFLSHFQNGLSTAEKPFIYFDTKEDSNPVTYEFVKTDTIIPYAGYWVPVKSDAEPCTIKFDESGTVFTGSP